jgi:hypothetical protein
MRHLEQTSLLFVGIPTLLAVIIAFTPAAKTTAGGIIKAVSLALLLSAPLLGEGFICILMAAPIFFAVALLVWGLALLVRKITLKRKGKSAVLPCLALLSLAPMSLEGTRPELSFSREETVTVRRVVAGSPAEVEAALSHGPRIGPPLPAYLRLGFPRPTDVGGDGLAPGDLRRIHFAGGEGHPGDLLMRVIESGPGHVRFAVVSDESKVAHWLDWEYADVRWRPVDGNSGFTEVEWTLGYRRLLDPAWYFRPWERYAVRLAAGYLIQTNATPAEHH